MNVVTSKTKWMMIAMIVSLFSSDPAMAIVCPAPEDYAPCTCNNNTLTNNPGTIYLDCFNKPSLNLTDARASEILNAFLTTPGVTPLGAIDMWNNLLTVVPPQIPLFPEVNYVDVGQNVIPLIKTGAFNFVKTLTFLYISDCQLNTIEPGAFGGKYGNGSRINIGCESNLTRFEADVFQSVLEQMAPFTPNATVYLYNNPIDCESDPCHLAWLIRDNRNLLPCVDTGVCSNGTRFEDLNPNGYSNCPVSLH